MSIEILPAAPEHIPRIHAIETQSFATSWTPAQLKLYLTTSGCVLLIAVEGAEIVGYLCFDSVLDEGNIANLAVAPEHRRRGIGQKLLRAAEDRGRGLGLRFLNLEARKSNAAAVALYEKLGYRRVGLRKEYYVNPIEDAVLMTKYL